MGNEKIKNLLILARKEEILNKLIVWLKAKNLYEQALKDIHEK